MHIHTMEQWQHQHDFDSSHQRGERRTLQVLVLTVVTMVVEIVAGSLFGSMALLADGWHMGTHAAAFSITLFAYRYARNHANDQRYTFGTGKVGVLGGFASAVALLVVALLMVVESIHRLITPEVINFDNAILVAILGLTVNLISAFLLQGGHHHHHDHHHDHNLRAAYLHVLADALTSILAIVALVAGKTLGWVWLDAVMGIVGAIVISKWAIGLLRDGGVILLDENSDEQNAGVIKKIIENDADNRIADLHLWKIGANHWAAIISIVTHHPRPPAYYKDLLGKLGLDHITVEVHPCQGESCLEVPS